MITEYITTNIIDDWVNSKTKLNYLIHGCNCQKTMGRGIAKEIKRRFYGAYECDLYGNSSIGDYSVYMDSLTHYIFNAYTQIHWKNGMDNDSIEDRYKYIKNSLIAIKDEWSSLNEPTNIFIPLIGAGLAGGEWVRIRKIIYSIFSNTQYNLYIGYWNKEWDEVKLNNFIKNNPI